MMKRIQILLVALMCALLGELNFSLGRHADALGQSSNFGRLDSLHPSQPPAIQSISFDTLSDLSYRGLSNQSLNSSSHTSGFAGMSQLGSGAGSYRVATRLSSFDSSRPWELSSAGNGNQSQMGQGPLDVDLLRLPMNDPIVPYDSIAHANSPIEQVSLPNSFSAANLGSSPRGNESGWLRSAFQTTLADQRNLYTRRNILSLGLAIGIVAPLANTSVDVDFRNWYQEEMRGTTSDEVSQIFRGMGDAWYVVPFFLATSMVDRHLISGDADSLYYTWSNRSLRSLVFGAPPLLLTQSVLGATRPEYGTSRWDPFAASNSASGHAFVGAVPFLVAASMTERPFAKYSLMAASTIPGITRINDDAHYLSQVILGWWISYLTVNSIVETDVQRNYTVLPITPAGQPGMSIEWRY